MTEEGKRELFRRILELPPRTREEKLKLLHEEEKIVSITTSHPADDKTPASGPLLFGAMPSFLPAVQFSRPARIKVAPSHTDYTTASEQAVIGRNILTGQLISVGDMDGRTGLYVLGGSGMGKSWLLVNLILQDIQNGHGLIFLDPHGSAIEDVLERVCSATTNRRHTDCLSFDPENETHSFGINILRCANINSINERQDTYTRAKGVFDKIWENAYYDLPWLQEIIQYTLYALIENQDYTLGDVPLFLTDRAFREHIVSNILYNRQPLILLRLLRKRRLFLSSSPTNSQPTSRPLSGPSWLANWCMRLRSGRP